MFQDKRKTVHGASVPPEDRGLYMPMGRIALDEQRERPWLLNVSGYRFKGRNEFGDHHFFADHQKSACPFAFCFSPMGTMQCASVLDACSRHLQQFVADQLLPQIADARAAYENQYNEGTP